MISNLFLNIGKSLPDLEVLGVFYEKIVGLLKESLKISKTLPVLDLNLLHSLLLNFSLKKKFLLDKLLIESKTLLVILIALFEFSQKKYFPHFVRNS